MPKGIHFCCFTGLFDKFNRALTIISFVFFNSDKSFNRVVGTVIVLFDASVLVLDIYHSVLVLELDEFNIIYDQYKISCQHILSSLEKICIFKIYVTSSLKYVGYPP